MQRSPACRSPALSPRPKTSLLCAHGGGASGGSRVAWQLRWGPGTKRAVPASQRSARPRAPFQNCFGADLDGGELWLPGLWAAPRAQACAAQAAGCNAHTPCAALRVRQGRGAAALVASGASAAAHHRACRWVVRWKATRASEAPQGVCAACASESHQGHHQRLPSSL